MKKIITLLLLLPLLAQAQYSGPIYKPSAVAITGGTVQGLTSLGSKAASISDAADADTKLISIRNTSTGTSAVATLQLGNNGSASAAYLQVYGGSHATLPAIVDLNNRNNAAVRILSNNALVGSFTSTGLDVTGRVGATTQYNVNGVLHVSATAPTVTGFGTSPSVPNNNGTSAFTVNVGTGGSASTGTVTLPAAATGWVCTAQDVTTPASFITSQTGGTTTTATFTNYSRTTGAAIAWTASDILRISCFAY